MKEGKPRHVCVKLDSRKSITEDGSLPKVLLKESNILIREHLVQRRLSWVPERSTKKHKIRNAGNCALIRNG